MDGHRVVCFARKAFDKRTPGLFKVEWCGDGFVGLCSKTYYCFGATDKYSTKGLSKRHNDIDKDTFLAVLKNRRSGGGFNRGFRVRDSSVMTYIQERAALTYFYGKAQSTRRRSQYGASGSVKGSDNQTTVHSPTWIHAGNTLSRASSLDRLDVVRQRLSLDCYEILPQLSIPHPNALRGITGNGSQRYENLDIPNLRLEEGLPTSFDASKRNIVVLDDLMAETDERVTNLFTKKSHHCNTSFIYLVQKPVPKKQGESHHQFEFTIHSGVQESARCVANDYIGQTDVPRSSQV